MTVLAVAIASIVVVDSVVADVDVVVVSEVVTSTVVVALLDVDCPSPMLIDPSVREVVGWVSPVSVIKDDMPQMSSVVYHSQICDTPSQVPSACKIAPCLLHFFFSVYELQSTAAAVRVRFGV